MPVLPGSEQAQVLNPSSPVPVGSTGDARFQGETIAQFGTALSVLGDALDVAGRKAKEEQDKLTMMNAENQFRFNLLERRAKQKAAVSITGDDSGFGAVKAVASDMEPVAAQIAQEIGDPTLRAKFLGKAGDILNDDAVTIWSDEVVKRTKNNEALFDRIISSSGALARAADNDADVELMLKHIDVAAEQNQDMPDAVKFSEKMRGKKSVLVDSIQGALSRKDYVGASTRLEKFSAGVFTAEEKTKQLDEIINTENRNNSLEINKLIREEKQIEKQKSFAEQREVDLISAGLQQAGNSDIKREPWLRRAELAKIGGVIGASKADSLIGSKVFQDLEDDKMDVLITTKAFKSGNFKAAVDEINKRKGDSLSYDRAQKMLDRMDNMIQRQQRDPIYQQRVQTGEQLIRAQGQESLDAPLSALAKKQMQTKINMNVQDYYKKLSMNPNANPDAVSREIITGKFDAETEFVPGQGDIFPETTLPGLIQLKEKAIKDGMALKMKGQLDKAQEKKIKDKIKTIDSKIKKISIKNPQQSMEENIVPDDKRRIGR